MNIIKNVLAGAFGLALFGFSQSAMATYWEEDPCGASTPCIEYQDATTGQWWHFNGDPIHTGWHGPYPAGKVPPANPGDPMGDFQFTGMTDLSCTLGAFTCELTLNGKVRKFEDPEGTWRIGVQVNSGSVAIGGGDNECEDISVGGFPWYAGHDPDQDPGFPGQHVLGPNTGIVYTGTSNVYTGHVGQIDVAYSLFGIPIQLVDDGHLHDVEYHNADSSFRFGSDGVGNQDNIIYEDGDADTNSGCTVDGTLYLQPPAQHLKIF